MQREEGGHDLAAGPLVLDSITHLKPEHRGKAVLAQTIYQAAERGTLARWINKTDDQIARAATVDLFHVVPEYDAVTQRIVDSR